MKIINNRYMSDDERVKTGMFSQMNLTELPDYLPRHMEYFNCSKNRLTTLKNSPTQVNDDFNCSNNKLTNLEMAPTIGGKKFYCERNSLISLVGIQPKLFGDLICYSNFLPNLIGAPEYVEKELDCSENKLTSLDGIPLFIETIWCTDNPTLQDVSAAWSSEIHKFNVDLNEGMAILPLVKFEVEFFNTFLVKIFNKNKGSEKTNIINLQYDLIENGFSENARWKPIG